VADKKLTLSNLSPAQERKDRKRIGRGLGSGKGRYSGRGIKGQKARAGSHKMRAGFEGGQMPSYMRMGKQRGSTSKDAMPIGPFRTYSQPVNVAALDVFDAGTEVTPELLKERGLIRSLRKDVKVLGNGDLGTKLTVVVHAVSASAREKIEGAGGSVQLLREPKPRKPKKQRTKPAAPADEPVDAEPEAGSVGGKAADVRPENRVASGDPEGDAVAAEGEG
jgi:large subunit ribosomal protein L15